MSQPELSRWNRDGLALGPSFELADGDESSSSAVDDANLAQDVTPRALAASSMLSVMRGIAACVETARGGAFGVAEVEALSSLRSFFAF